MKFEFWIIIFILIALIFVITGSSGLSYVPYYRDSRYLNSSPYEGFTNNNTLKPSTTTSNEPVIDIFSTDSGSPACIGDSNSLFNSMGGLCLTDEQKNLLKTRGGNATGGDFKYGK
jgi:hypothetical protein